MKLELDLTDEQRASLKKSIKEGFVYQRLRHTCGYRGNCYHKVDGKWSRRTHCPQCDELLKWIPLEEVVHRILDKEK